MTVTARQELSDLVKSTDPMKGLYEEMEHEPLRLLCQVCQEHEKNRRPVPDHRIGLVGYFAETALRALVSAGLLKKIQGSAFSIYEYEPTDRCLALYRKLVQEGACRQ